MTAPRAGGGAETRVGELTVEELVRQLEIVHLRPLNVTRSQAAVLLNVDRHHVGELVREGHLKTVRMGPGERYDRIPREDVERLARVGVPQRPARARRTKKLPPAVGDLAVLKGWKP